MAERAVEDKTVALGDHGGLNIFCGIGIAAGEAQRCRYAAFGNCRQPARLLRFACGQQQGRRGHAGGGEERRTEQAPAHLFQQYRQFDKAQAKSAVGFGNMNSGPVHLAAQPLPQVAVVTLLGHHRRAYGGTVRYIGEKALGRFTDHFLLVAERKFHRGAFAVWRVRRAQHPLTFECGVRGLWGNRRGCLVWMGDAAGVGGAFLGVGCVRRHTPPASPE
ncbi:hypothetical protein D3C85_906280 [compost metagenome]